MKTKIVALLLICINITVLAQRAITVENVTREQLPLLSHIASIDNYKDGIVMAYANEREMELLNQSGFTYQIMPEEARNEAKTLIMANSVSEMSDWNKYPTYDVYLQMMALFAEKHPTLCHIDTIGRSTQGRLILSAVVSSAVKPSDDKPQFFYSSTIHGDEITGFLLMLRLIDTLLNGYETNDEYRNLLDNIEVYINPLANPDGTYYRNNNSVANSIRYNANLVDLNRNYPDPFGTQPLDTLQAETIDMMNYISRHRFLVSANLHGGSEVLNYPWDSFTSAERMHPLSDWWVAVCKQFINSLRQNDAAMFTQETLSGYIAGGDWYVISNGRQDWVNYYTSCREMTIELSVEKRLRSESLNHYWNALQKPLVEYIETVLPLWQNVSVIQPKEKRYSIFPNPTRDILHIEFHDSTSLHKIKLFNTRGERLLQLNDSASNVNLSSYPSGTYIIVVDGYAQTITKI